MAWSIWLTFLLAAAVRSEVTVSVCQAYSVANTVTVTTYLSTITEYGSPPTTTTPNSGLPAPEVSAINTLGAGLSATVGDTEDISTGNVPSNPALSGSVPAASAAPDILETQGSNVPSSPVLSGSVPESSATPDISETPGINAPLSPVLSGSVSVAPALPNVSGTQGLAVGNTASGSLVQTYTQPASGPVVSTDPQIVQSTFMITFTTPSNPIDKRQLFGLSYLGFNNNLSWLYPNPILAAMFYMNLLGALQSGNMFVAMAASNGGMGFMLQAFPPLVPIAIVIDPFGGVYMPGASGFCSGSGGFLNMIPTYGSAPAGCAPVVPGLVAAPSPLPAVATSTVPVVAAQIAPATTTLPPNNIVPSSPVPYIPIPSSPVPNIPIPNSPVLNNIVPSSVAPNIIQMITSAPTATPLDLRTVTAGNTGSVLAGYYRFCSTLYDYYVYCSDIALPPSAGVEIEPLPVLTTAEALSSLLPTTLISLPALQSPQPEILLPTSHSILPDGTNFQTTPTSPISDALSTSSASTETTTDDLISNTQSTSTTTIPIGDADSTSSASTETATDDLISITQSTTITLSSSMSSTDAFSSSDSSSIPAPTSCPNSRILTSTDGSAEYLACPDTDRLGSDILFYVPTDEQDCLDSCASSTECLGIEYRLPTDDVEPYCWHKGPAMMSTTPGYVSGLRATNRPVRPMCENQSTQQGINGVEFLVCPDSSRLGMRTVAGAPTVYPATVVVGSAEDCMDECAGIVSCAAWTYEVGSFTCVLQYLPPLTTLVGYEMALLRTW